MSVDVKVFQKSKLQATPVCKKPKNMYLEFPDKSMHLIYYMLGILLGRGAPQKFTLCNLFKC